MLGEVVKFIMTIVSVFEWFFKPRVWKPLPPTPQTERLYSPAEQRHWRGYVINNECKRYIGKNPAYKSSNGF
tara:strand:+ start:579 stop:794 length:216 start_codon:yes stop_codon:yes gene_type:complete